MPGKKKILEEDQEIKLAKDSRGLSQ